MHAKDRKTGLAITATLETLHGKCGVEPDGFGRSEDGEITHRYDDQGTEMFWDSAEQTVRDGQRIYFDANDDHVTAGDIVLYAEDGTPEPAPPARRRPAAADPEAAARGFAERFITQVVTEVDDYHEALAAAREVGREHGEEDAEQAVAEAHEAFVQSASQGIADIEVASGFMSLSTTRDTEARIIRHVQSALIVVDRDNALTIHCSRIGERFSVDEVSAREYGHVCHRKPDKAHAAQLDVWADAVLSAWGPWDR